MGQCKMQRTRRINADVPCATEFESDVFRIRARRNDKVVFQLLLISVVHKINAWVDVAITNPSVCWHVGLPGLRIIADQVVDFPWEWFFGSDRCVACPRELRYNCVIDTASVLVCFLQAQDHFVLMKTKSVGRAMGRKADWRVELADILFKAQRQRYFARFRVSLSKGQGKPAAADDQQRQKTRNCKLHCRTPQDTVRENPTIF